MHDAPNDSENLDSMLGDPGDYEDHELPTRQVMTPDDDDFLGATQVSGAVEQPESWRAMVENIPPRTYHNTPPPTMPPPAAAYGNPPPPRRRRRKTARERRNSGWYLPWWSLLIMLGIVGFFVTLLLLGLNMFGGQSEPGGEPVVIIITEPTETPFPTRVFTSTPTPRPFLPSTTLPTATNIPDQGIITESTLPVADGLPTEAPFVDQSVFRIGATVAVIADALNIREGAGTSFTPVTLAQNGSLWRIVNGPQPADDFIWWQLQNPEDPLQQGWAAEEFLEVVLEP